jgi:phosphate transport system substrate-binding protein
MESNTPKYVFLGLLVVVVGGLIALAMHGKNQAPQEPPLKGAGSTFVYPLMVQWSGDYEKWESGCRVGYQSLGSQAGIDLLLDQRVNFACTEAPLTDAQLAKAGEVIHVPLVLGAVVPAYNLPGVKGALHFTGPALADIYLGKVRKWNDPALRDLNPGVELPDREIAVVRRRDGSGTTFVWADFLAKVSPEWKKRVGVGTTLSWPTGTAEMGNEGVAEKVHNTPGAIGYVELTYAYRLDLPFGLVRNREGEFVKASLASVSAAAANALSQIPDDLRFSLTDAPGKGSYPIVGTTWAIAPVRPQAGKAHQLADFLRWATGPGQDRVGDLFYVRLPKALAERAAGQIGRIQGAQ